ncbi:hypothetical protein P9139_19775 [Curtobacterium flaccumfaciens]|nr:hypothetical protein P9139_19775 [Curtobacterium flaccumfaciens]
MTDGVERARTLLADAARTLRAAGVRDEALGVYVEPKTVLGVHRDPTMRRLGRVWRVAHCSSVRRSRPAVGSGRPVPSHV